MKEGDLVWMPIKDGLAKGVLNGLFGPVARVNVFDGYKNKLHEVKTDTLSPYIEGEPPTISLALQIKAVQRELAMREGVYPKRVASRAMTQDKADYQIAAMRSVLATLEGLREQRELAKQ